MRIAKKWNDVPRLYGLEVCYLLEMLNRYDRPTKTALIELQNSNAWRNGVGTSDVRKIIATVYNRPRRTGPPQQGLKVQLVTRNGIEKLDEWFMPFDKFRGIIKLSDEA